MRLELEIHHCRRCGGPWPFLDGICFGCVIPSMVEKPVQDYRLERLAKNFEYLLWELRAFQGYIEKEWGFPSLSRSKEELKYDQNLQWSVVDKENLNEPI